MTAHAKRINAIQKLLKEMADAIAEAEAEINAPHWSPAERRALRADLKMALKGTWFELPAPQPRKSKKSAQAWKADALQFKTVAANFDRAGRPEDAKRYRQKARRAEREAQKALADGH